MRHPGARWIAAVAAVLAAQTLSWLVAPVMVVPPMASAIGLFAVVVASVLLVGAATPPLPPKARAWLVLPALVIGGLAALERTATDLGSALAVSASLLFGGSLVGGVVGARIQHPSHVMVVAYVSSIADVFSVFSERGLSAQVVQSEQLLSVLAISWPIPGSGVLFAVNTCWA